MPEAESRACPVCGLALREPPSKHGHRTADVMYFHCPRCGKFGLTRQAEMVLPSWLGKDVRNPTIFGHSLRRMQIAQEWPLVDSNTAERIITTGRLPTAQEQADNLVRWLGDTLPGPGELQAMSFEEHGAIIGGHSMSAFVFVVKGLIDGGWLSGSLAGGGHASVTLTFAGWQRYEELRRGAPSGRRAFMALQYSDPRLDRIVNEWFRPAVGETGFELKRLDDDPRAGLIDDHLRVEIQGARFLIADLTHRNSGAYWEAGYAEGLGKPVIYTCERSVFDSGGSHFDTSHHLHVLWEETGLKDAVRRLKATIRATIPEAKLDDG